MRLLLAGVAAIALAASAAQAGPGNGKGQAKSAERGKGGPPSAEVMRGNGNRSMAVAMRGNGKPDAPGRSAQANERGNGNARANAGARVEQRGNDSRPERAVERGRPDTPPAARGNRSANANANVNANANANARGVRDDDAPRAVRVLDDGRRVFDTRGARVGFDFDRAQRGLIDGCPPGLAKKNNGCMPPGLAKRDDDRRFRTYRPDWWGLGGLRDGRYIYDDGYLLRLNGDRVGGYVPLLGGALSVGNRWPEYYSPFDAPPYYVDYFDLGGPDRYRYADRVLYRVDPSTAAITSIAALLTGDDIQIGAPMPLGYDIYNVPYAYRDRYYDSADANYRYSDGYIYQVDPATRLVTAAIELMAS